MEQQYRKRAIEILKDHEYTLLTSGNDCEVWRCGKPNTNCYAFNIALMPMGISVVGDIGDITFGVGRGMDFLAGMDVDYYIYSKLTPNSKDTEYAEEEIESQVADYVKNDISNDTDFIYEIFGVEEADKLKEDIKEFSFQDLKNYIYSKLKSTQRDHESYHFLDDLNTFIVNVSELTDARSAYELIDGCKVIEFHDVFEWEFERPSKSLMQSLYIVNEAAKCIVNKKTYCPNCEETYQHKVFNSTCKKCGYVGTKDVTNG